MGIFRNEYHHYTDNNDGCGSDSYKNRRLIRQAKNGYFRGDYHQKNQKQNKSPRTNGWNPNNFLHFHSCRWYLSMKCAELSKVTMPRTQETILPSLFDDIHLLLHQCPSNYHCRLKFPDRCNPHSKRPSRWECSTQLPVNQEQRHVVSVIVAHPKATILFPVPNRVWFSFDATLRPEWKWLSVYWTTRGFVSMNSAVAHPIDCMPEKLHLQVSKYNDFCSEQLQIEEKLLELAAMYFGLYGEYNK